MLGRAMEGSRALGLQLRVGFRLLSGFKTPAIRTEWREAQQGMYVCPCVPYVYAYT